MKRQHVTKKQQEKAKPSPAVAPGFSPSWKRRLPAALLLLLLGGGAFGATFLLVRLAQRPPAPRDGMVWIPGGEFTMGTDDAVGWEDEKPAHRVRVGAFWMDETEVTNAQFRAFV